MANAAFIAADVETANIVSALAGEMNFPVDVMVAYGPERLRLTKELIGRVDVIISRWGFDLETMEERFPVSLVDVPITAFDFVRALHRAKQEGKRIGVVHNQAVVNGMLTVARYLEVEITSAVVIRSLAEEELLAALRQARSEEAELIIAGVTACRLCPDLHLSSLPLQAGPESITQALNEARRIIPAQLRERERAERFQAILDFAYDGIIAVDHEARITVFNHKAEELLGLPRSKAIGMPISAVMKQSDLPEVLQTGKPLLDVVQRVGNKGIVSNNIPISINGEVTGAVQTFIEVSRLQETEGKVRRRLSQKGLVAKFSFNDIIGHSENIQGAIRRARRYAEVDSSILIYGETGTGKEIFAQSIHNASRRAGGPFVAVNCAALPESLLESELFGYVDGAFTGARREGKVGLFELAHGGSIFLDEVSELPLQIQGRFLRVLQEREVNRIGDDRVIPVDIRVIAATNRDLATLVEEGRFRQDLYFRLNVLLLQIPPLRDRAEDVPELLAYFVERAAAVMGRRAPHIPPAVINRFMTHTWPGNVRELANLAERLVALADETGHLPEEELETIFSQLMYPVSGTTCSRLDELEVNTILRVLREVNGNKRRAAEKLGISVTTLWRRLKALGY